VQRDTAALTTSTKASRIEENFDIDSLPEDEMKAIQEQVTERVRFNAVARTGVPGFIAHGA
jgi:diketogulonate reductase-like aldo/keto reductase